MPGICDFTRAIRPRHARKDPTGDHRELDRLAAGYPQIEALTALYGIGTFSALLIVAELGEVERFNREEEIAAYAGLTPNVHQSGSQDYHGAISKSGSPWLRWILVEASIKVIRKDPALRAFHQRVRRRSGWRRARVAVARKLAVICWKRLRAWERQRWSRPDGSMAPGSARQHRPRAPEGTAGTVPASAARYRSCGRLTCDSQGT